MIPLKLELTNFLSYRETAVLEFGEIHLACISGENGAGKSSLLDGMTWALFGVSRTGKSDENVVNRQAAKNGEAAQVRFTFGLDGAVYRVVRIRKARGGSLELQIADENQRFKALTETKMRETQAVIEQTLGMNADIFTNVSFFLQGRADEFTTKTAARRKEILAELLGVDQWDLYKSKATDARKAAQENLRVIDARIGDIEEELLEQEAREGALAQAQAVFEEKTNILDAQEKLLATVRTAAEAAAQQKTLVQSLENRLNSSKQKQESLQKTMKQRQEEEAGYLGVLADKKEIEEKYEVFKGVSAESTTLQSQSQKVSSLRESLRPHELAVKGEESRLQQEIAQLVSQEKRVAALVETKTDLAEKISTAQAEIATLEKTAESVTAKQAELTKFKTEQATLLAEQKVLRGQMDELKEKMGVLEDQGEGVCPCCGQVVSAEHLQTEITRIKTDGTTYGDQFRENKTRLDSLTDSIATTEASLRTTHHAAQLTTTQRTLTQLETQAQGIDTLTEDWETNGKSQLAMLQKTLETNDYADHARTEVTRLTKEIAAVGFEPEKYQAVTAQLREMDDIDQRFQTLGQADAALKPLRASIKDLETQLSDLSQTDGELQKEIVSARSQFDALNADARDLLSIETEVNRLRQDKITATRQVGVAQQNLNILEQQKTRREQITAERAPLTERIAQLELLEKATGRDGVQALLIEQALPAIEDQANVLLGRLTNDEMRIYFETQRELKSKKGELRETLDIIISDANGQRPYENFSGGEQFRINFAIRLAMSRVLAQRSGARLQTLVIDEGFGSQDPTGRQRLVEAINAIKDDFELILIITHIDELRDAFPTQILVNKSPTGSQITIQ